MSDITASFGAHWAGGGDFGRGGVCQEEPSWSSDRVSMELAVVSAG